MLSLTRHEGQETVIVVPPSDKPTKIVVRVTKTQAGRVQMSWDAPISVTINRREIEDEK